MNFLSQLLRGVAFIPALVNGIEGLFGGKSGAEKKDAAMSFLQNALAMTDAVASREIVNPEMFKSGISLVIDGVVQCLNASAWAKSGPQAAAGHTQP
jgi:predicted phage tail protein